MQATDHAAAQLTHRWIDSGSPAGEKFLRAVLARRLRGDDATALPPDPPWLRDRESFLAAVERQRLGPLLHRAIGARDDVPASIRAALLQSYRLAALRHLLLMRSLERCLAAFAAADVGVIVLKGAALAALVYDNPALRPMVDLDLLVRHADVGAAARALGELGYAPLRAETRSGMLAEYENELTFSRQEAIRIDVDLHWSLIDSPFYQEQLAMDWFWSTARRRALGRTGALTLGAEAQLLHLCAHLMLHHGGSGLVWWNDIAEVVRAEGAAIDWDEVVEKARGFRLLLPLREVLDALAAEWGVAIPAAALRQLARVEPTRREAELFAHLSAGESAGERLWTDLRSMTGWRRRLRFAATNLFPAPAYMRRRYRIRHAAALPVYYAYRWWRGCRDLLPLPGRRRSPPGHVGDSSRRGA
jgi:hypothetical protein